MYTYVTFVNHDSLDKRIDNDVLFKILKEFFSQYGKVDHLLISKFPNKNISIVYLDIELFQDVFEFLMEKYNNPHYGERAYFVTRFSNRLSQDFRIHLNKDRFTMQSKLVKDRTPDDYLPNKNTPYRIEETIETRFHHSECNPRSVSETRKKPNLTVEIGEKRERVEKPSFEPLSVDKNYLESVTGKRVNINDCSYPIFCLVKNGNDTNLISFNVVNEIQNFMDIFTNVKIKIIELQDPCVLSFSQYVKKNCLKSN